MGTKGLDLSEWEQIGNNDLRLSFRNQGGFSHIVLRDADDGDVIVINEDDVKALRDRLTRILESPNWLGT